MRVRAGATGTGTGTDRIPSSMHMHVVLARGISLLAGSLIVRVHVLEGIALILVYVLSV